MAPFLGLRARLTVAACIATFALVATGAASATTATAFGFDSSYRTLTIEGYGNHVTAPTGWNEAGFDDSSWVVGQAPFGNGMDLGCNFAPANSPFPERGRVLLRKTFSLPAGAHGLRIQGTVDNHAHIYVNGHDVGEADDGNCQKDGIDFAVPDAYLNPGGDNLIAAAADDWSLVTFFDIQATYEAGPSAPPTVTPVVTGTQGTNGWYTSDVGVSWTVAGTVDSTSGCDPTTVATDTAGVTFTCTATNSAGSTSQSVTVKRDTTAPVLAPSVAPAAVLKGANATAGAGASDGTSGVGSSSCAAPSTAGLGPQQVECHATDAAGNTASGTAAYLVYGAASGGSFVVGDRSATGAVTFWGAQWAKLNSLSGGSTTDSFKGFAASPAACGAAWTAGPGNSGGAPAGPLPAYMAVIVTSKVTKSGSQIGGTVAHVVVVKTNPGYASDPGHAGTGTVVATVC
jgi:hypothetical protein